MEDRAVAPATPTGSLCPWLERRSSTSTAPCSRAAPARSSPVRCTTSASSSRRLPGEGLLYKVFDLVGETLPSIALARQATLVARGRAEGTFDAAAAAAAEAIAAVIHPFALTLIEQHRAAGRPVVLATTTPDHLIRPLADRLGVDHVIATRYRIGQNGTYDGALDGPFVWSRGKLRAVREWAAAEGIDLGESFAYSDSIYDLPLLSAVGRPAAVNPDPRLAVYALARGWPIVHFDVSPGVVKLPVSGSSSSACSSSPATRCSPRRTPASTSRAPRTSRRTGPGILVGNHRSYFDIAAMIQMMRPTGSHRPDPRQEGDLRRARGRRARRRARRHPGGPDGRWQGVLRDGRGRARGRRARLRAAAGHHPARRRLLRPRAQGPHRRGQARRRDPRPGHPVRRLGHRARLAAQLADAEDAQPHRPADGTGPGRATGAAPYRSAAADTRRIMAAISELLPPEAREARQPTEEEIRLATPGRTPRLL